MSEAEKANQESDVFLQQVRLKNYKSIIDAEIDFKPGLNIIIGNNGSGKTNFLTYLYDVVDINWTMKQHLSAEFTIVKNDSSFKSIISKKYNLESFKNLTIRSKQEKTNVDFFKDNDLINSLEVSAIEFNFYIFNYISYYLKFLKHGVPKEQDIVDKPIQVDFFLDEGVINIDSKNADHTYFIKSLYNRLSYSIYYKNQFEILVVKEIVENLEEFLLNIKEALSIHTEIQDLRISPNFNIYQSSEKGEISVHNLYFEFYINKSWLPFSNISDGSKRLFFIFSEILSYNQLDIMEQIDNNHIHSKSDNTHKIILLEEPELGIHPHQLHKLMLFIKEQSKEKQIILTTHSPQVLNILEPDELDRIIICSYDQQKGTQLNHLTESQIKKGQMYMRDEGFLSDYWVHSDLESVS